MANIEADDFKSIFFKLESLQTTLYSAGKNGLTIEELMKKENVSRKTIMRWLNKVEEEDIFPVWYDENTDRYGIQMDYYIKPFSLRTTQALYIFLACRMLIDNYNRCDSELSSLFYQLSNSLPNNIKKEVDKTLTDSLNLPHNPALTRNVALLAQAWIDGKTVDIFYKNGKDGISKRRKIEIYFMQPSHHTTYVIAYCHMAKEIRVFKTERIEKVIPNSDKYSIPEDFNANEFLSSAWGVIPHDPEKVVIKVSKEAIPFITETKWHKSQVNEIHDDYATVTFEVGISNEVINWIMQWGELVEVIEPLSLRNTIIEKIDNLSKLYRKND